MVTERCNDCKYSGTVAFNVPCCDYAYITGKLRGCKAGDDCNRYEINTEEYMIKRRNKNLWGK
jgi:hypothetical protein